MLDPKEQAKGGFRAHAAREQERRDMLVEADAAAGDGAATPLTAASASDGTPSVGSQGADGETSPYAPPTAPSTERQPKRWR